VERLTEVHHTTIVKLLVLAGAKAERLMAEKVRNVDVRDVELDEVWGFSRLRSAHQGLPSHPGGEHRYSPADVVAMEVVPALGRPDPERICTSIVERSNLSLRMGSRRFTRLTNAFSKKWENHWAAVVLWYCWYNFGHPHKALRMTPAMPAGISDHVWTVRELLEAA
jgi:hypothetical protein